MVGHIENALNFLLTNIEVFLVCVRDRVCVCYFLLLFCRVESKRVKENDASQFN